MSADRFAEVERLYHEASTRRPEERAAFLDQACGGDQDLRHEVESLLSLQTEAEGFLSRPAIEEAAGAGNRAVESLAWPKITGYTVLRVLGHGGMGVVYLAEQEAPLRRLVALKLIKAGMDSQQVLARFDLERQALARMDHPNIASVYDAGQTAQGQPYFVMECVDGPPITAYCDEHRLSTHERLELFQRVCAAVQHAHQKGVIHRDLKPSNVLVTEQDGRALPKVIDFGTAKAVAADETVFGLTVPGLVIGTLEYMSPEQASLSTDVDTTSDVYSLGVLLHELLVGDLPFGREYLRQAGYDEMRRIIRESDPIRPSVRLTARNAETVAASRSTDPGRLAREIAGDLDWVVLRAIEKDRRRRYATVADFSADVGRVLNNQPVEARPASAVYRLRKFARRHRIPVAATGAVVLAMVAATILSANQYLHAKKDRAEAEYQAYVATVAAASLELQTNAANSARQRLLHTPPGLRQWEWHHLFLKTDSSIATLSSPSQCTNGPLIPSRYNFFLADRSLMLDDAAQIYLKRCENLDQWTLEKHEFSTYRPGGDILAVAPPHAIVSLMSGSRDHGFVWQLRLIDLGTHRVVATVGPLKRKPLCADVSRDGSRMVIGLSPEQRGTDEIVLGLSPDLLGTDGVAIAHLEVFDVPSGQPLKVLGQPIMKGSRMACMVTFGADSNTVAVSAADVRVWDVRGGRPIAIDATSAGRSTQPIAFSPDGRRLAIGRSTGLIDILSLNSSLETIHLDGAGMLHSPSTRQGGAVKWLFDVKTAVLAVAFSPDGSRIVSGSPTGVGVWDVSTRRLLYELAGHVAEVNGVAVMRDGRLISSDTFGEVKVWSADDEGATMRIPSSSPALPGLPALSADGNTLAIFSIDGGLSILRLDSLQQTVIRPGNGMLNRMSSAPALAISADGSQLFVADGDPQGLVRVWQPGTGSSRSQALKAESEPGCERIRGQSADFSIRIMAASPDGRFLALGQGDCVVVRDLQASRTVAVLRQSALSLSFRPDGSLLLASFTSPNGSRVSDHVQIWDWRGGRILADVPSRADPENRLWRVVASADGQRIATLRGDWPTLAIWDGRLSRTLGFIDVPRGTHSVAFSLDGRRIATTGWDANIRIWDAERFQLLLTFPAADAGGLAFVSEDRLLAPLNSGGFAIFQTTRRSVAAVPATAVR